MNSGRLQKLLEMIKVINSRFELSEILQVVVNAIASEIAEADLVGFFMKQSDGTFRGYKGNKLPVDIKKLIIDPKKDLFVGDILVSRESLYIPDTSKDLRADPDKIELLKIKSILGVPVIVGNEVFGIVFVHDFGRRMELTDEQLEMTEAFVNMASVAISNIQMFEQSQFLLKKQQLLLEAANALSKSLSSDAVLETCFHYMEQAASSCDIGIHLYNEDKRVLYPFHLASTSHFTEDDWKGKHAAGIHLYIDHDPLFKEIVTQKIAIAIEDVFDDPRPNHDACREFNIKSLLLVPLVVKGVVFGVVALPSVNQRTVYTKDQIDLCQSLADMTAAALSNAIYAESLDNTVRERAAELQYANLQLEQTIKELRLANQLKDKFIASMSHELRTPITAIKGSVDILRRGILGPLTPTHEDILETCSKAIDRLLNQVNELLDFSKLENGNIELVYDEVGIDELIEDAVRMLNPLAEKKCLKITIQRDAAVRIKLDRQRILQVLLNLISNSIKFTNKDGRIVIKSAIRDNAVCVEVCDTGIGIPSDKRENIFSEFYQINNHAGGTGLGLAISKRIVELHKGRMWFESEEGVGSTFNFIIPIVGELEYAGN
jgi:signal transduction histidine kinase